jgi:DNA/RNA-binding domain of Phe-tRNA-synthetase-like protein
MHIQHSPGIWAEHPDLVAGIVVATGLPTDADVTVAADIERYIKDAQRRLAGGPESELPEIQAWRRAFTRMGLKPTQYRCAAESLLRRYRKEQQLPRIHPLIDLCNAASIAFAIPVAALDTARISDWIEVRHATGEEEYLTLDRQREHPARGEVIFADAAGRAHARRWTNRQSGYSAVRSETSTVLIVAEALHATAATDVAALTAALADDLARAGAVVSATATLHRSAPRCEFSA